MPCRSAQHGCLEWIQHLARGFSGYSCLWSLQTGPTLRCVPDTKTVCPGDHCCRRKGPAMGEEGTQGLNHPRGGGASISLRGAQPHTGIPGHELHDGRRVGMMVELSPLEGTHDIVQRGCILCWRCGAGAVRARAGAGKLLILEKTRLAPCPPLVQRKS